MRNARRLPPRARAAPAHGIALPAGQRKHVAEPFFLAEYEICRGGRSHVGNGLEQDLAQADRLAVQAGPGSAGSMTAHSAWLMSEG